MSALIKMAWNNNKVFERGKIEAIPQTDHIVRDGIFTGNICICNF